MKLKILKNSEEFIPLTDQYIYLQINMEDMINTKIETSMNF